MFLLQQPAFQSEPQNSTSDSVPVIELLFGGSGVGLVIIIILLFLLGATIFIFIERYLFFKHVKRLNSQFVEDAGNLLRGHNPDALRKYCDMNPSILSRIVKKIIGNRRLSYETLTKFTEDNMAIEIHVLEKNVGFLTTISGSGPMLGFLGTVIGMVISFYDISKAGGQADMAVIANGIYTALNTTVWGLVVGITSHLAYNYLVTRTEALLHEMHIATKEFLDYLKFSSEEE